MSRRLEELFGERSRFLVDVAIAARRGFRVAPRDEQSALVALLVRDWAFINVCYQLKPRHILTDEPEMGFNRWSVPPLSTEGELAAFLDLPVGVMTWFADPRGYERRDRTEPLRRYIYRWVKKRSGGERLIEEPKRMLCAKQRRIAQKILRLVRPHDAAHGFTPGRSVQTFIRPHVGRTFVARLDLVDFFPNIRRPRVFGLFRAMGYPDRVAWILACLCTNQTPSRVFEDHGTWEQQHRYMSPHLPQGAPTSPAIANLCAYSLDTRLSALASRFNANYTRYADDLAFSGDARFQRSWDRFRNVAAGIARDEGFSVNFRKVRAMPRSRRQSLTGVVVNEKANLRRADYDALKATLHNCIKHGPESQNRERRAEFRAHLLGRITWVKQLNPARGAKLEQMFARISWGDAEYAPKQGE